MRMRPACARNPDAGIAIDLRKSTPALLIPSTLAERGLYEAEAAAVERRDRLVVHLVGRDLIISCSRFTAFPVGWTS